MKLLKTVLLVSLSMLSVFLLSAVLINSELARPKTHTVQISQMQFKPASITVAKGDTVIFVNNDFVTHDVTEISGAAWKSPALAPGDSWLMTVSQTAGYFCSYHPTMKGKIIVK